jgi:hypothetical protein
LYKLITESIEKSQNTLKKQILEAAAVFSYLLGKMAEATLLASSCKISSSKTAIHSGTTTTTIASDDTQIRRRNNENLIIFWLNADVISLELTTQLRQIINSVYTFADADECINCLTEIHEEKIFFILSENFCEEVVPLISHLSQIKYIYALCSKKRQHEQWTNQYHKVRGIYEDIPSIRDQMRHDARQCLNSLISMSVIAPTATSGQNNNEQEASFMYSRLLNEIFIDMETIGLEVNALKTHYILVCKQR